MSAVLKPKRYSWEDYERAKQDWMFRHPEATHEEYERAMREIAKKMGI